jgi:tRNA threonylcarbamoyladenosine modification (KEOPS) complex  Pcc1 subunit
VQNVKFSSVITLPVSAKGILKSEKRGRSATTISVVGAKTTIKIVADDMSSFRATVNSVLRDLTVVESVSKAAGKTRGKE